eukprot:TRINITY_DN18592_c0_g1_i1.p1 TRINITY_DN18592_c0_g1~~TRINITY_DN18592_c0_g1_i1.p1  ORF type:complete len:278 (+),score=39.32 TRINITY_DN18592_c0_g1_i1:1-834(+)
MREIVVGVVLLTVLGAGVEDVLLLDDLSIDIRLGERVAERVTGKVGGFMGFGRSLFGGGGGAPAGGYSLRPVGDRRPVEIGEAASSAPATYFQEQPKGYCKDWKYLPEGAYPPFLHPNKTYTKKEQQQECLDRCIKAYGPQTAFYLRLSDMKCGCSKGQCDEIHKSDNTRSYKVMKYSSSCDVASPTGECAMCSESGGVGLQCGLLFQGTHDFTSGVPAAGVHKNDPKNCPDDLSKLRYFSPSTSSTHAICADFGLEYDFKRQSLSLIHISEPTRPY